MSIRISNAPCSWGVEFADDPRNPAWTQVLEDAAAAGFTGIELGPIGFMPEDPAVLADGLGARGLTLVGGVVFQPFHDETKWDAVFDASQRTCRSLSRHGAKQLVLIDSISPRRAPAAARPDEAEQMDAASWSGMVERIRTVAKMGAQEYGLTVGMHAHAGGFCDFEPELERILDAVDESLLKICLDTGHTVYAGFDPVAFMKRHMGRISYMHFKDIDPEVKRRTVANRTDFYEACADGIFCKLGEGSVDFRGVRDVLLDLGYAGWCTVEQDCDPQGPTSPIDDARANRDYLRSIGFVSD